MLSEAHNYMQVLCLIIHQDAEISRLTDAPPSVPPRLFPSFSRLSSYLHSLVLAVFLFSGGTAIRPTSREYESLVSEAAVLCPPSDVLLRPSSNSGAIIGDTSNSKAATTAQFAAFWGEMAKRCAAVLSSFARGS